MTRTELAESLHKYVETRIREGVKAIEEMTAHIGAARRKRSLQLA